MAAFNWSLNERERGGGGERINIKHLTTEIQYNDTERLLALPGFVG